jgi:hypothetical protein
MKSKSSSRRIIIGGVILIVLLFVAAMLVLFEPVTEEITLAPEGIARTDRYYALKLLLKPRNVRVVRQSTLSFAYAPEDTLVLLSDSPLPSREAADALLDRLRARSGGLFLVSPFGGGETNPMAEALGLEADAYDCAYWRKTKAKTSAEGSWCGPSLQFDSVGKTARTRWRLWSKDGELIAISRRHGRGVLTIAPNYQFLRGRAPVSEAFSDLVAQLLAPIAPGSTVHIVADNGVPKWYVLLVREAWIVLIPALLALLAWLKMRSARLGIALKVATTERRSLREHLRAAGDFAWRRGHVSTMNNALIDHLERRIQGRQPAIAQLDQVDRMAALSALSKLSVERLKDAFSRTPITQREQLFARVQTLLKLRASL